MRRLLIALVGFSFGLAGCEPDDPNVSPRKRDNFAQSRAERNQAIGLDYLQFAIYRLADIKQIVEAAAASPEVNLKKVDESFCGQLVVDRTTGVRREQRFETTNCTIQKVEALGLSLKADGVDIVESSTGAEGEIERLLLHSVVPYQISGRISESQDKPKERAGSQAEMTEQREFSLDLMAMEGDKLTYRFSYFINLNWTQEIKGVNFTAFEDGSKSTIVMKGSLVLVEKNVESIALSSLRMDVLAPRSIKDRARYTKGRTPDDLTFHKINLVLKPTKGADKKPADLTFGKDSCGLPVGALEVAFYKSANKDDRLSKDEEKTIVLSPAGILVKATDQVRSWPDCAMDPADKDRFKATKGEVRNRGPYHELLFK